MRITSFSITKIGWSSPWYYRIPENCWISWSWCTWTSSSWSCCSYCIINYLTSRNINISFNPSPSWPTTSMKYLRSIRWIYSTASRTWTYTYNLNSSCFWTCPCWISWCRTKKTIRKSSRRCCSPWRNSIRTSNWLYL